MLDQQPLRSITFQLSKTELPAFFFGGPGGLVRWLWWASLYDGTLTLTRQKTSAERCSENDWSSRPITLRIGEEQALWPDVPSTIAFVSKNGAKARVRFQLPEHVHPELFVAETGKHLVLKRALPPFMGEGGWMEEQIRPFRLPPCAAAA